MPSFFVCTDAIDEHTPMLEQINVVTLEQAVAAPLCTSRLAQAGAECNKNRASEGDFARYYDSAVAGESAYFVWLNAGKKSVVLDLRTDQGLNALNQLIERADVLVQNQKTWRAGEIRHRSGCGA